MSNFGDWQLGTYLAGLTGEQPQLPMSFPGLERAAEAAMSPQTWSYVAGGAGDENTQDANVRAFHRYGLMPRMLAGAGERDLSVELFGQRLPSPLLLAPVGVLGLCGEDGHGDLVHGPRGGRGRRPDDRLDAVRGLPGGRRRGAR